MKKSTINRIILTILGIVLFIVIWQVLSLIIGEDTFIFPGPAKTFIETLKMLKESYIYKCLYETMYRMAAGFAIAFILAFVAGTIAGNSEKIEFILKPTMTVLRSLPTATIVYFFLVIAGARLTPLFIVVLVSFPILYESILGGIKSVSKDLVEASKIDGANIIQENISIKIPLAIPYIVVGIASSFALSLKIEIMAEVITGYTRLGLGSAILAAQRSDPTNMVPVFAYSLVAIVVMLVFDVLSNIIKAKFSKWYM